MPNPKVPGQMQAAQASVQRLQIEHSFLPMQNQFDALASEMKQVREHTARIPNQQIYRDEQGNLAKKDVLTGSKTTYVRKP